MGGIPLVKMPECVIGVGLCLLITLNIFHNCSNIFIAGFERINVGWVTLELTTAAHSMRIITATIKQ